MARGIRPASLRKWVRAALAGPGALILAALIVLVMPLWMAPGTAGIDNLVVPVIAFPLIWAALFFYMLLDRSLMRALAIAGVAAFAHGGVLAWHFAGAPPPGAA